MQKHIFLLFIAFFSFCPTSAQVCFHVSPTGTERGNGSARRPFGSVQQALSEAEKQAGDVEIVLHGGVYRLRQPLKITQKTANSSKKLVLRSTLGEHAVLTGAQELSLKWAPAGNGIWKTHVRNALSMDRLLVNGTDHPMARYPNYDSTQTTFGGTAAACTDTAHTARWKNPGTGYLHAMHKADWGSLHYRITGVKDGKPQLEGGWQTNRPSAPHPQRRMVENLFEELDAPGEWFHDKGSQTLYYYPLENEKMPVSSFEGIALSSLLELRGTATEPVENVIIDGITLTGTRRTFMETREPLLRSDWAVYRGGAILLEGTRGCTIRNCDFRSLGGNAVFHSGFNECDIITGCHFLQLGASAVLYVGRPDAVRSPMFTYGTAVNPDTLDMQPGPQSDNYPRRCRVEECLIHDIGLTEKQSAGVQLSMCYGIEVLHNTIYNVPRAGINVSEGTWGGHLIAHNDVFATVRETGDHGAFNSWGRDRFWQSSYQKMEQAVRKDPSLQHIDMLSANVLTHNRFRCDRGWDIDLDDGSSNYIITDNLCLSGGIKLREGFNRRITNNILVNNSLHPHVWFRESGDVFMANAVTAPYKPIGVQAWGTEVDRNIFADSLSYRSAREAGTDAHSAVTEIDFTNPSAGNYAFPPTSGVLRAGFHNFPMDNFGVTLPRLRSLLPVRDFPTLRALTPEQATSARLWQRAVIKKISTQGERSATGMDSERGILIVSTDGTPESFKRIFSPGNVILKINNLPTNDMKQFDAALASLGRERQTTVVLFREQREQTFSVACSVLK